MAITLDGTTGVTAVEFDGTVDASNLTGVLPAIDGSALTGIDTSPPTTYGAVGTYVAAYRAYSDGSVAAGDTVAGSTLIKNSTTFGHDMERAFNGSSVSAGLSGTWRAMSGATNTSESGFKVPSALYVRIS